jgi:hypothetical protein
VYKAVSQWLYFCRHVDLTKTYSALLASLYKTLFNIDMRRQAEQEEANVKAVLTKRERTDVAQDASLLTRIEREVLAEWKRKRMMRKCIEQWRLRRFRVLDDDLTATRIAMLEVGQSGRERLERSSCQLLPVRMASPSDVRRSRFQPFSRTCIESVQMHCLPPFLTSALSVLYMPHTGGSISRMIVVVERRVCENVHVW